MNITRIVAESILESVSYKINIAGKAKKWIPSSEKEKLLKYIPNPKISTIQATKIFKLINEEQYKLDFKYGQLNNVKFKKKIWQWNEKENEATLNNSNISPNELIGIAVIDNIYIIKYFWEVAMWNESGFEYILTDEQLPIRYIPGMVDETLELTHFVKEWIMYENVKDLYKIKESSVPKIAKKCKDKVLYRGVTISQKSYDDLKKGKSITLKSRKYSSWTPDLQIAKSFTKGIAIIMKYSPVEKDILLNTNAFCEYIFGDLNVLHSNEKEIILKNNKNLLTVDPDEVVYYSLD